MLQKTFSISLEQIDNILQLLQQLKEDNSSITLKDIHENKDKLHLISKLIKECESKPDNYVCQQAKKPDSKLIKKILNNIVKIEDIMKTTKEKDKEKSDADSVVSAVNTFVALEALNNSENQKSHLTSFLNKLKSKISSDASKSVDCTAIEELLKTYSAPKA